MALHVLEGYEMVCRHCGSCNIIRNGRQGGVQRFHCRSCQRYSRKRPPKFSAETRALALDMHLNNVGIRKIARFTGASPATIITWIRKAYDALAAKKALAPINETAPDIIEMDEIYTFVKKQHRAVIWTAYSRQQRRVVAYHIGDNGVSSALALYELTKQAVHDIAMIFTDANSCYRLAFERNGVPERHEQTKAQTHLIESANSSIRDNLARFNRRSKRYSKSMQMLDITLDLFFNRHLIQNSR